jgi:YidC/Oxa1 family membrane protein insertase
MGFIGEFFDLILITPLTNAFVLLATLTGNAGIAVILLTIIIKVITLPLQFRQLHGMRAMQAVQPRMQEIQKRYKDPRRRQQEMVKLYREAGINPLGCLSGLLIQMPILIALYRVFFRSVGETPESVVQLSEKLYSFEFLRSNLPLPGDFLWMHMGSPDPLVMPLAVAVSMYTMQKLTQVPTTDEKQRAQQNMMNLMLPLLFGFFTIQWPSALGLYWALSNVASMIVHYLYVGGGPINWRALVGMSQDAVLPRAVEQRQAQQERFKNSGRSDSGEDDEEEVEDEDDGSGEPSQTRRSRSGSDAGSSTGGGGKRRRRRYGRGRR